MRMMPVGAGFTAPVGAGDGAGAGVGVGGVGGGAVSDVLSGFVVSAGCVVAFFPGSGLGVGSGGIGVGPVSTSGFFVSGSGSGFLVSGVGGVGASVGGISFAIVSIRKWLGGGSSTPLAERALTVWSE